MRKIGKIGENSMSYKKHRLICVKCGKKFRDKELKIMKLNLI